VALSVYADNFLTTLASAHTSGATTFVLASGDGTDLASRLSALGYPSVSSTAPLRFTVYPWSSQGVITDTTPVVNYKATGLSGDTLSGVTAVDGTSDRNWAAGDVLAVVWGAGQVKEIRDVLSTAIAFDNDPSDGQVPAWVAADGVAHWSDPSGGGIGSGPWSFVDDTNTAPTAYFEKSYSGTYPSGGWDNGYAALEIANRNQTDGSVAYVSFSGHGTGGFSSAVLACTTTSHAAHYGNLVFMTRAADGLNPRLTLDSTGAVVPGLTVGSLSGLLKASSGVVSTASAGTDYLAPSGNGSALTGLTVSQVSGAAPLASPTFTGTPAAPTAANSTNTTQVATCAYVMGTITQRLGLSLANYAALSGATFSGAIGVNGASPPAKAASPGTATGTDAAVVNAIAAILRNLGFCS